MAQGAPIAAGGAHLQAEVQAKGRRAFQRPRPGLQQLLVLDPGHSRFKGRIQRLEQFIKFRVGQPPTIEQAVAPAGKGRWRTEQMLGDRLRQGAAAGMACPG